MRLFLIDGSSYFYRAYFAIKQLSTKDGFPTNAIYGFTSMLEKLLLQHKPDYVACVLDSKAPSFRKEIYHEYKANREKMPDNLSVQIPYIKKILEGFNVVTLEQAGFEADDIIGSLCKKFEKAKAEIYIVSGDKDMMQLISDGKVCMFDTLKDKIIKEADVTTRFGVVKDGVTEVMGLSGDSSDNVPGIPGVGEKTAKELIAQFGTIENVIKNADAIKKEKLKEKIKEHKALAILSKELVTIKKDLPLDVSIEDLKAQPPDSEKLKELFQKLEFNKFLEELGGKKEIKKTISYDNFRAVLTDKELDELIVKINKQKKISIDTETTSEFPILAELVGISIYVCDGSDVCYYIPVGHAYLGCPNQLQLEGVLNKLKVILESDEIKKIGQNIKYDLIVFSNYGIKFSGIIFDSMVASYVLHPEQFRHNLKDISQRYIGHSMISYEDVTGKGAKAICFSEVNVDVATKYSCEDAYVVALVHEKMSKEIEERGLSKLYHEIEIPLVSVLAKMEIEGVKIDEIGLKKLSEEFDVRIKIFEKKIYELAGENFNINSPKQLSEILFNKLNLPVVRKTKTGFSTDSEVLEELSSIHELPKTIVDYRSLVKLKTTYIDALPILVNKKTGRIHTSFNQTVTATGRLSSSAPNLQNIPIRSDDGKMIREMFIAEKGYKLISADYSQIELRILADLSEDKKFKYAFDNDLDIHKITAGEIFNIPVEDVSQKERASAKTINFGLIYGMSAFGLSRQLQISPSLAKNYIDNYFERYSGVKKYLDEIISNTKKDGYVCTLLGRRRYVPEILSSNKMVRQGAERIAINTPVQGTSADLIKIAMINIHNKIQDTKLKAKMILQVHDELVFEVPENEVNKVMEFVKYEMENVIKLSVPLKVDVGSGYNWKAAH